MQSKIRIFPAKWRTKTFKEAARDRDPVCCTISSRIPANDDEAIIRMVNRPRGIRNNSNGNNPKSRIARAPDQKTCVN